MLIIWCIGVLVCFWFPSCWHDYGGMIGHTGGLWFALIWLSVYAYE